MNHYEEKQQARKERYEQTAAALTTRADRLSREGWKALDQIPFGQPILVGHHSERGDRAFRSRATGKIGKSVQEREKAEHYEAKAEGVGKAGISSDDPEAVRKLKEKLEGLEKTAEYMKKYNGKLRKFKTLENALKEVEAMEDDNPDKKVFTEMLNKRTYYAFPPERISAYYFFGDSANIRSVKKRIEQLQKQTQIVENEDVEGEGYKLTENKDDNRIRFIFDGKPAAEIRTILKSRGFRWSPYNKAWQRMLNSNGRYAAKNVIEELKRLNS